jgi:hypothetical protein
MKRKLGILAPVLVILALVISAFAAATPTMAQTPPDANSNEIGIGIIVPAGTYYEGDTINYRVRVFVPARDDVLALYPARQTDIDVYLKLPGEVGFTLIDTIPFLDAGETWVSGTYPYVVDLGDAEPGGAAEVVRAFTECFGTALLAEPEPSEAAVSISIAVLEFAELGDFVWHDMDRDGLQGPEEEGIEGVTVNLWSADANCDPVAIIDTMLTDADGYYLFDELRAGKYLVQFILPGGDWVFTTPFVGADDAIDSNADPATGISDCVELAAGDSDMTIDAGMYMLYEELTVEKTATAYFSRTHLWDIDKEVTTEYGRTIGEEETPKIWLVQNGTGDETATWNVCVTYLGYEDDWFNIFGMIIIENTGTADAVITDVEDLLCGELIAIEWPVGTEFPVTLEPGESLVGIYGEYVDEAVQDCINEVTVTTERAQYSASADVIWGDPYVELYDVVNIEDVSDLFGTEHLGTLDAADLDEGDVVCFDYGMFFAWTDYFAPGPYIYDNTATIIETGQNASARLIVNWTREELCWGDETAWAYGEDFANPNWDYVNNRFWGWTNGPLGEGHYMWPIYAGAGQNILDNGYVVGTLHVEYVGDCVTVKYEMDSGYYMGETHLWVGNDVLPEVKRGRSTVYTNAPGQFPYGTHQDPGFVFDPEDPSGTGLTVWTWDGCGFDGDIYVAAHSVVWMEVECPEEPIA